MTKNEIKVVKKFLEHNQSIDHPQVFPKMPRLYLEIIENKKKVKQDLVNKEYIPPPETPDVKTPDIKSPSTTISLEETKENDDDELTVRLKELLKEDNKYSRPRDKYGRSITHDAPTLSQLEDMGGYVPKYELKDINRDTENLKQDDIKRELLFKFEMLKKSYPNSAIPDYTIHTDLNTLERSYDDHVRRLSLDSSVESYKTYLIYGFIGCEFIFGNFLGFDMQGFTQQQITSMNSYEKLLIELGEKSYVPTGSKFPVELRLLFMIIMNAAVFIISRMLMKKTGANILGLFNKNTPNNPIKKRRMKEPNIDVKDIPL